MPVNPFGGIGARDVTEQTSAIRAYEQARKRLISTMKGEERATAALQATQAKSGAARARDALSHEKELTRASMLLGAQGLALKKLDVVREKYHREEMDRSKSLLQRYEDIKQALREIQEDSDDTSTILGTFVKPMKTGIDQMLKLGTLPRVTRPIKEVGASLDDVGGSLNRAGDAAGALGQDMLDVLPTVWKYRTAVESLNVQIASLKLKYADAGDGTEKLAYQFIELSKTDIVDPNAVKSISAVTDSLKYLEAQGVSTETALGTLVERSRKSGRSFEESAHDLEQVSAQADILRESLEGTDNVLQGFSFTVRDDFVRAIADATRNLDSQVVSIENVSAAYAYAAEAAAKYGLSAEASEKVAKAVSGIFFQERQDAAGFLSGQELQAQLSKALKDAEESQHVTYSKATDAQKKALEDAAYAQLGITATDENRAALKQGISTLGEGLGATDLRNLLAGTTAAIKSDLDAQMNRIGLSKITDTSVASRILSSINGFEDLTTLQKRTVTELLQTQGSGAAAEEIERLQKEASERASETKDMTSSALSAVLTMKDPIQQLFNIKDFLKATMLNMSNVVKILEGISSFLHIDLQGLFPDTTSQTIEKDYVSQAIETTLSTSQSSQKKLLDDLAVASKPVEGETEEARRTREAQRDSIARSYSDTIQKNAELVAQQAEHSQLTQHVSERLSPTPEQTAVVPPVGSGVLDSIISTVGSMFGNVFGGEEATPTSERGREAGLSLARRTTPSGTPASTATPTAPGSSGPTGTTPSELEASGTGNITVSPSGESILTVRMRIRNMGEVIAYHNTQEARQLDQFGLGG